jgi:ABC-type glycerol-3-phosphate transport system permease component
MSVAAITPAPVIGHGAAGARTVRWSAYLIVGIGALFMLAPFWFTFVFATHSRGDIFNLPPPLWFGTTFLANFRLLTGAPAVLAQPGLSLYVATMTTALNLLLCALAGYAFAVHEFAGKKILFALVVAHDAARLPQHDPDLHDDGRCSAGSTSSARCTCPARPARSASS